MSRFNADYRLFFKKLTNLTGKSITSPQLRNRSLNLNRDLLTKTVTTFNVIEVPNAIENGDIVGMYDNYGTVLFLGQVSYVNDSSVQAYQMNSIFGDSWLWNNPRNSSIEQTLKTIIQNDFQNSRDTFMNSIFNSFDVNTISNTNQILQTQEDRYITDFDAFLYDVYEKYSIQMMYEVPYSEGRPTINIGIPSLNKITISNNSLVFRNFEITENVYETNKMIVYSEETGQYRATWYGTKNGITDNPSSLGRIQKIKTNIIYSDDNINILKASSLRNEMYNHEIKCDVVYDNNLLKFEDIQLGQEVDLWYNGQYFNTILTGYSLSVGENQEIETINLKFGLVRTDLTTKLFKRLAK